MQQVQIFQSSDGAVSLEVSLEQETVWLSQAQMCELSGRDQSVLSRHIRRLPHKVSARRGVRAGTDAAVAAVSDAGHAPLIGTQCFMLLICC